MHDIKRMGASLVAIGLLVAAMAPAFASVNGDEELSAPDVRGIQRRVAPNEVTLNGKTLFIVPRGAAGLSAAERADVIRQRLEDIAEHYVVGTGNVTVSEVGADTFAIAIDGQLLATVEPATARAAGEVDTELLADRWAERVRMVLPGLRMTRRMAARGR